MKKVILLSIVLLSFIFPLLSYSFSTDPYFDDVPDTHWAFKYVQKLYEDGITTGCTASTYCPTTNVNRAQMAAFIARAFLGM